MKNAAIGLLICMTLLTSACGISNSPTQDSGAKGASNPPYRNLTEVNNRGQDPAFDTQEIKWNNYEQITVYSSDGRKHELDPKQPVLIEAYWCPHCQRTLSMLASNESKFDRKPVLLSSGFTLGTTLQEAVQFTNLEMKDLKIEAKFQVYYYLGQIDESLAPYLPTLVFSSKNSFEVLSGEHTLSVWEKALR